MGSARDAPRCEAGVGELSHAQSDIDPFFHQIDVTIVEYHFNFEIRMPMQEFR
jgi:hypothetical protein